MLEIRGGKTLSFRWRLNECLLDDQEILNKGAEVLKDCFDIKLNQETDLNSIWDASKSVMRGFFIQQNAYQKKRREQKKLEIMTELVKNE